MEEVIIKNSPYALKEKILECSVSTYETHRSKQPFGFPKNMHKAMIAPSIDESFVKETGEQLAQSPNIFTAEIKGTFAGYVQLSRYALDPQQKLPLCVISDIFVLPEFRKQGVASQLLNHVKQLAMENRWSNLTATVWAPNQASAHLFEKEGFTVQSRCFRFGPTNQAIDLPPAPKQSESILSRILPRLKTAALFIVAVQIAVAIGISLSGN
ncbi:GNAT family N-acetyltransferase [Pseudophaeobacter sp.]|uniref:GNAT family N-acetyltransferase n=1 Tax=Pseudophaeobacter sp. TaxID=1971739 RepID=UPI00329A51F6